jgi:hypothetical protein
MIPGSLLTLTGNPILAQAAAVTEQLSASHIVGTWIAAVLTLCIFSFLYEDNPLYRFAEHLFVGVSAGYHIAINYRNVILPNLITNVYNGVKSIFQPGPIDWISLSFILAGIMGVMLLMKLIPNISWIARWPLSFMVGIASGLGIVLTMEALVLKQINATVINLLVRTYSGSIDWPSTIQHWLIFIGVCSGLIYFYFSKEHKGFFYGTLSRIGIYVLMMAFGAAFGYTVMARVSLLIGRMLFFRDDWWPVVSQTGTEVLSMKNGFFPPLALVLVVAALVYGIFKWITQKPEEKQH